MNQHRAHPDIYQLRIVLRGISPLIWRRLLVRDDTTLAQLHLMLQILFAWSNEHLHHFHIYGKDYGSNDTDTRHVTLRSFGLRQGERFQYVYNYYAHWQCDIRLEATAPWDPTRFYPVCTGGQRPAPPEHVQDTQTYLELLDEHRYPSWDALRVLADAAQVVLDVPAHVSIREAISDLDAIRDAMDRLEIYQQLQPSAFQRRPLNAQLRRQPWTGVQESCNSKCRLSL
jgi:Plasmid pRiA4b ORF-3-like protein